MTHEFSQDLVEACQTLEWQTKDAINPTALHQLHHLILGLPENVFAGIGCSDAFDQVHRAAKTLLEMREVLGDENWPIAPQEAARRAVCEIEYKVPWDDVNFCDHDEKITTHVRVAKCKLRWSFTENLWYADGTPQDGRIHTGERYTAPTPHEAALGLHELLREYSRAALEYAQKNQAEHAREAREAAQESEEPHGAPAQ